MKKKSKTLPDWFHLWYAYRSLRITDVEGESDQHVFSLDPSSVTADCWASFFPSSCWTCQRVTLLSFFFTFFNFIGLKGHLKQLASSPLTNRRWQLHAGTCRRCEKTTLCGRTIISLSRWTVKSPEKVKALIGPHVGFSQGIILVWNCVSISRQSFVHCVKKESTDTAVLQCPVPPLSTFLPLQTSLYIYIYI